MVEGRTFIPRNATPCRSLYSGLRTAAATRFAKGTSRLPGANQLHGGSQGNGMDWFRMMYDGRDDMSNVCWVFCWYFIGLGFSCQFGWRNIMARGCIERRHAQRVSEVRASRHRGHQNSDYIILYKAFQIYQFCISTVTFFPDMMGTSPWGQLPQPSADQAVNTTGQLLGHVCFMVTDERGCCCCFGICWELDGCLNLVSWGFFTRLCRIIKFPPCLGEFLSADYRLQCRTSIMNVVAQPFMFL